MIAVVLPEYVTMINDTARNSKYARLLYHVTDGVHRPFHYTEGKSVSVSEPRGSLSQSDPLRQLFYCSIIAHCFVCLSHIYHVRISGISSETAAGFSCMERTRKSVAIEGIVAHGPGGNQGRLLVF